jgi:hypothetical protein
MMDYTDDDIALREFFRQPVLRSYDVQNEEEWYTNIFVLAIVLLWWSRLHYHNAMANRTNSNSNNNESFDTGAASICSSQRMMARNRYNKRSRGSYFNFQQETHDRHHE